MKRQRTINVTGEKIKVEVTGKTYMRNSNGFSAKVTSSKWGSLVIPHIMVITANEAIERAFVKFCKTKIGNE